MARVFEEKEYPRDGKSLLFLHLRNKLRNKVSVQINWKKIYFIDRYMKMNETFSTA